MSEKVRRLTQNSRTVEVHVLSHRRPPYSGSNEGNASFCWTPSFDYSLISHTLLLHYPLLQYRLYKSNWWKRVGVRKRGGREEKKQQESKKVKKESKQTKTKASVSFTMISPITRKIPSPIMQSSSSLREFRRTSNHPYTQRVRKIE